MSIFRYVPGTSAWKARRDERLCRETAERVQEIVDGEAPPSAATDDLLRHLDECAGCGEEAEVYEELKRAIARVGRECDPQIVQRLEQLARRLCEGGEPRGVDGVDGRGSS